MENNGTPVKSKILLNTLGIIFFIFALAAILNTIYQKNPEGILWLCYIGLFIISLGMLFKNDTLIVSQLNILIIPLSIWIIDFFSYFYLRNTGQTILGITEYMFTEGNLFSKIISLQHFFTIPFSLGVLSIIKIKQRHAWIFSTIQLAIVFTISRFFTSSEKNINYVFRFAEYDLISPSLYPWIWFAVFFIMVLITNFFIEKIFSKRSIEIIVKDRNFSSKISAFP